MKHVKYFSDLGLDVGITLDGNLKIKGLSALQNDLESQMLQYAKKNKWQILFELQTQSKTLQEQIDILWTQAEKLADWIDDSCSAVPWQERAEKVSELQEMSLKIDRLKAKKINGVTVESIKDLTHSQKNAAPPTQLAESNTHCPAKCRSSGKCYGMAYFDAKSGKALNCLPSSCGWI